MIKYENHSMQQYTTKFPLQQSKFGIIQYVSPELRDLYRWLEVEFHPLELSARVSKCLEHISQKEELAQYKSALQSVVITRLLKQVRKARCRASHHQAAQTGILQVQNHCPTSATCQL